MQQRSRGVAVALVAAILVAGCTGGDEPDPVEVAEREARERGFEACAILGDDVAATLQEYVDQFAVRAEGLPNGPDAEPISLEELQARVDALAARRAAIGCGRREFQVVLQRALASLDGQGSYAAAVGAWLREQVLPTTGPLPTVFVEPGDDLAAAVHDAGTDALVQLEAGMHSLDEPLVLLRGTRLVGAGTEETIISSSAPGSVIVFASADTLRLEALSLVHGGTEPASVLVVEGGAHDLQDVALRGGVAGEQGTTGWGLVLTGRGSAGPQTAVDVVAADNDAGGVAVAGQRAPTIDGLTATGNGACGICYFDRAGGTLAGAELAENVLGLSVAGEAAPRVEDLLVRDNSELGILIDEESAPVLLATEVRANGGVGVAVRGSAAPAVTGLVSEQHDEAGVLVEGDARPTITDVEVRDARIGVFVRGTTVIRLDGAMIDGVADAHVVAAEDSGGRLLDVACATEPFGIVLLGRTTVEVADGSCEVADQREGGS